MDWKPFGAVPAFGAACRRCGSAFRAWKLPNQGQCAAQRKVDAHLALLMSQYARWFKCERLSVQEFRRELAATDSNNPALANVIA
jgi:hypothetical protein